MNKMLKNNKLYLSLIFAITILFISNDLVFAAKAQQPELSSVYTNSPLLPPGAIITRQPGEQSTIDDLDDYDQDMGKSIADPFEPWNRFWFGFNDIFYLYIAQPAYNVWEFITPEQLRTGLNNFFSNLLFPVRFANNLLQFKFKEAGVEFGRFFINTVSSAGFANVAKDKKTIVPVDPSGEDFGQTLGYWGIGHGFYLVWPFLGPSSARDTIGRVGDYFVEPISYMNPWWTTGLIDLGPGWDWGTAGIAVGLRFNAMGELLPTYKSLKNISLDPYIAMREAYVNMRNAQVKR